jgi:hypothetical protein
MPVLAVAAPTTPTTPRHRTASVLGRARGTIRRATQAVSSAYRRHVGGGDDGGEVRAHEEDTIVDIDAWCDAKTTGLMHEHNNGGLLFCE